jgi:hypothetical protein
VRVSGILSRNVLYADVDGIYQRSADTLDPSSNGGRLGLSSGRQWKPPDDYRAATVTGRVGDCEQTRNDVQAMTPLGEIWMATGYCHTAYGAYLGIEDIRIGLPAPPLRQLPERARADYGNLAPAPANWRHASFARSQISLFLAALRSGDAETLAALHFFEPRVHDRQQALALTHFLLRDGKSPFADIRSSGSVLQTVILVQRDLLESTDERDASNYAATVCFCRRADCGTRWPIASWDVDNLRSRPYACTHVGPFIDFGKTRPMFDTAMEKYGLAEPP